MAVPHPSRSGGHFAGLVSGGGGLLPTPRQVVTATAALPVDTRTLSRKVTFLTLSLNRQHFVIPFDRLILLRFLHFYYAANVEYVVPGLRSCVSVY